MRSCIAILSLVLLASLAVSGMAQETRPASPPNIDPAWMPPQPPGGPELHPTGLEDGHGPRGGPPRISEERIEELMDRMKTEEPEMHQRLEELRETRPGAFNRAIGGIDQYLRQLEAMPAEAQAVMRRNRADNVLAAQLMRQIVASEDEAAKADLEQQLREVVARQFDDSQKLKEFRLQAMQAQLELMKQELRERAEHRNEIIDARMTDLLEGKAGRFW